MPTFTATPLHAQVVEIFMCGVMPAAGNGSWSEKVSDRNSVIIILFIVIYIG